MGSLASLEGPGGEQYAVRAKDRQAAAGGDHGNQYTGGKVAVKAHGPEAVDRKQASDEAAEVASTEVQDLAESKAVEVVAGSTSCRRRIAGSRAINTRLKW